MNTIGTCKDCKYWSQSEQQANKNMDTGYGTCSKLTRMEIEFMTDHYNSPSYNYIETDEDFGCILWEVRDSK